MFKIEELQILMKSLRYSINAQEDILKEYDRYMTADEKKKMLKDIKNYNNMEMKTGWIIGNKEAEKILSENVLVPDSIGR